MRPCSGRAAIGLALVLGGATTWAADPVPLGPTIHVNSGMSESESSSVSYPDIARGADGGFVVVWQNLDDEGWDVFGRTFDASGAPTSDNQEMSTAVEESKDYYPFVDSDADGNFVVVWTSWGYSSPSYQAMARRADATATPVGSAVVVTGSGTPLADYIFSGDVAVGNEGNFVVAWDNIDYYFGSGDSEVAAQRFDADANFVGSRIQVASQVGHHFRHPTIGLDADDAFVVVWTDLGPYGGTEEVPVSAQQFAANGTPVGSEIAVTSGANDFFSGPHRWTPVSMNASGQFVVAWIDYDTWGVNAQRYDANGTPLGGPLAVTATSDRALDLVLEDDGDVVVVWVDDYIMGRRYDATAAVLGSAFQVSETAGFDRYDMAMVASTTDDAFVVAWSGNGGLGLNDEVFARRFGIPQATGIAGTKLVIVDKLATAGKAKVVFVAKNDPGIQKGPAGGPATLSGSFEVFYTDDTSVAGSFILPTPWQKNDALVAKYVNTLAPSGGQVKVALVKNDLVAKVRAKGLGDGPAIDLFAGPPSASGGVTAVLTVVNAGLQRRLCTRFATDLGSEVAFSEIAGGLGRKLVATGGVPTACP
jgi:hypothetical protein